MFRKQILYLGVLLWHLGTTADAQNITEKTYDFQLNHELHIGKIVPNYRNYPSSGLKLGYSTSFLWHKIAATNPVNQYFKNPKFGFQLAVYRLGNPSLFGNQFDAVPIIELPTKKGAFQFGLGVGYFSKMYKDNEANKAIGSRFNWSFQAVHYWNIPFAGSKDLRLGFGYHHASNGHTQLPNYGLNSAVIIVGLVPDKKMNEALHSKSLLANSLYGQVSAGLGYHEFGSTSSPIGGSK